MRASIEALAQLPAMSQICLMVGTFQLVCHPRTPTTAVEGVQVRVKRLPSNRLQLDFTLIGNRGAIKRALRSVNPQRTDGLWKDTCFEAFVMPDGGPGYFEFNFAFSHDWAAYEFSDRREGMRNLDIPPPQFDFEGAQGDLSVEIDLGGVEPTALASEWRVGLSAVLADRLQTTSYWALSHPDRAPDFHDPACFTATLPAPPRA
ncbi:hypothetical protein GRI89_08945 [Altererythrobacter salegens]|uniref:DOMON-like domain-containing protein n=1 Tax=Croceibacterium salegens TaxID=1737568 RepID=A0A6I4SUL9_9SPHN|nr:DOMON-like domain-containing protein [Croceibacterium salegens]MXO59665.1 hypothetical protein [Croceibacterium salegens]